MDPWTNSIVYKMVGPTPFFRPQKAVKIPVHKAPDFVEEILRGILWKNCPFCMEIFQVPVLWAKQCWSEQILGVGSVKNHAWMPYDTIGRAWLVQVHSAFNNRHPRNQDT